MADDTGVNAETHCLRCNETVRPPTKDVAESICQTEYLHKTCACFLNGDYFATNKDQTKLWRPTKAESADQFLDCSCCFGAMAVTCLPAELVEEINDKLDKPCTTCILTSNSTSKGKMRKCNLLCCPLEGKAACLGVVLGLLDENNISESINAIGDLIRNGKRIEIRADVDLSEDCSAFEIEGPLHSLKDSK